MRLAVLLIAFCTIASGRLPAIDAPKPEPKKESGPPADFKMTSEELQKECKDRKAAEAKYKGKIIELSGTVEEAKAGYDGKRGIIFLSSTDPKSLGIGGMCLIDDPNPHGKFAKGQTIKVKGKFTGVAIGPTLEACTVLEKGPDTAVRITSEELAKDYTADRAATEKKCDKRTLVITGEVAVINTDDKKVEFLELKGDGATRIECRYGLSINTLKDKLKPGDKVTLVGEMFGFRNEKGLFVVISCVPVTQPKK
ncbi:MAG: hypothetical protein JWO38_4582 [Gemmataceae bacterium]|nr:hypothetical protein [Gemmataceae bacterium]